MSTFDRELSEIFRSEVTNSVILYGNIYDLFPLGYMRQSKSITEKWTPLVPFLRKRFENDSRIQIIYELNGPVFISDHEKMRDAWVEWKTGLSPEDHAISEIKNWRRKTSPVNPGREFDDLVLDATGKPALAMELIRQFTMVSRSKKLKENLFIMIEGADMAMPASEISRLTDAQYRRITTTQHLFCDTEFVNGKDCICLIAESPSLIHSRISSLPHVMSVEVKSPDYDLRKEYIKDFVGDREVSGVAVDDIIRLSAGLSIQALRQLLTQSLNSNIIKVKTEEIIKKVESFIKSQVGEDVVEFSKPEHRLEDVIGNANLKKFLHEELIPRFKMDGSKALPGAAVGGSIGVGKTFIFEAVAAELGLPVIVLKSLRSQWYGQTDVIFERLRRVLEALQKAVIFVDEADTQFNGVGQETHATERRLTGKIQAMMSDPKLRGKVLWLLMTARIHLLSPDIRRPGRVGDLIIPVLDPEGDDRESFIRWMINRPSGEVQEDGIDEFIKKLKIAMPRKCSAAYFASLKSYIDGMGLEDPEKIIAAIEDHVSPDIGETRRYQELQALVNCTRKCLLEEAMGKLSNRQVVGNRLLDLGSIDIRYAKELWHEEIR
ncbi:MAG: AAA family ATPase, partial [Candidatus Thorarchaeota archaeon]